MNNLFKLGYLLGVILLAGAVWHFIVPADMAVEYKIRLSGYVVLIFVVLYFVVKNIFMRSDDNQDNRHG